MAEEELRPCGLVMKGGVTSGVVYPGAIKALSGRYWFTDVGGTSAGAIAAAVTAAAEYGRRGGDPARGGSPRSTTWRGELGRRPAARPLPGRRAGPPAARRRAGGPARGRGACAAPPRACACSSAGRPVVVAGAVAAPLLVLAAAVLAVADGAARGRAARLPRARAARARRGRDGAAAALLAHVRRIAARLPGDGLRDVPGHASAGLRAEEALTEWLHRHIQSAAGLPLDRPLTFAMLAQRDIHMEVMTTDLGAGEPRRLPLETPDYLFDRADMAALFPPTVVAALAAGPGRTRRPASLLQLPTQDLSPSSSPRGSRSPSRSCSARSASTRGTASAPTSWRRGCRTAASRRTSPSTSSTPGSRASRRSGSTCGRRARSAREARAGRRGDDRAFPAPGAGHDAELARHHAGRACRATTTASRRWRWPSGEGGLNLQMGSRGDRATSWRAARRRASSSCASSTGIATASCAT